MRGWGLGLQGFRVSQVVGLGVYAQAFRVWALRCAGLRARVGFRVYGVAGNVSRSA